MIEERKKQNELINKIKEKRKTMLVEIKDNVLEVYEQFKKELIDFEKKALEMKLKQEEIKKAIKEEMEKLGILNLKTEDGLIEISYRKPSSRTTIDSKRLKEELPDIAEEYSQTSNVSSSISLKINA